MLDNLLKLRNRLFPPASSAKSGREQTHDVDAREHRAQMVSTLRDDIQRIQHAISDLNDTMTESSPSVADSLQPQMASLHRELAEFQRKLGTFQARI